MGPAESLSLIGAFIMGVVFALAASLRGLPEVREEPKSPEPQGEPVIGPPPGWKP